MDLIALSARASGPDISAPLTSAGPPLTPEQLAALPHDNQGPHLVATVWTLVSLATLFLAARVYCKFSRHRGLWWDDWILIASWVCITVESAVMTYAVQLGYGKHIWDIPPDLAAAVEVIKAIDAGGALSLIAAVWSKTSFALTLLRLVDGGWMRWVLYYIIISMNIAMGLSALFIFIQCTPLAKSWDFTLPGGSCWPVSVLIDYDIFSASYSAACDIALALLPWKLLWGLQIKKKEKIGVAVAMGCGIFAGITAIIKTTMIYQVGAADPADGVVLFQWGNAETCVTIIAASIPILRVLFREVSSSARRRYYISNDPTDSMRANSKRRTKLNTVTVTGGPQSRMQQTSSTTTDGGKRPDDWSDKSILEGRGSQGRIVQTNEVNIEYHDRKDTESVEYEMDHLAPV